MTDPDISHLFSTPQKKNSLEQTITNEFSLDPEIYYGNTEYKLMIKPDAKRKKGLATQMGFRLREGNGRAVYWLGIMDNGYALGTTKQILDESIKHIQSIAGILGVQTHILSQTNIGNSLENIGVNLDNKFFQKILGIESKNIPDRFIASIEVIACKNQAEYDTVTVGVMGNVNAGKSTLIGTLVTGEEDDGKGRNRTHVAKHVHELTSGRTSSVGHIILGYVNENTIKYYQPGIDLSEITKESNKILKLFDLAGHEKYMKTTIKGLTHYKPNYVAIAVEACKGITDITRQHVSLCKHHKVQFFFLITKIDQATRKKYAETHKSLGALLKTHFQLMPNVICDMDDANRMADQLHQQLIKPQTATKGKVSTSSLVPVIDISCVTGEGLDLLKRMLYRLEQNREYNSLQQIEFYLENIYEKVQGVGLVVSGLLTSGTVTKGTVLNIGPDISGKYQSIKVKSIHVDKQLVDKVTAGYHCSFAITGGKLDLKKFIKKDMVILDDLIKPMAYKTFNMIIKMLNTDEITNTELKKITLGVGSNFIIQFNNVRRPVTIQSIDKINIGRDDIKRVDDRIFPEDKAKITVNSDIPVYIKKGDMCVLTDSHMFGMGIVSDIVY